VKKPIKKAISDNLDIMSHSTQKKNKITHIVTGKCSSSRYGALATIGARILATKPTSPRIRRKLGINVLIAPAATASPTSG
jgi:hypothetical protein